MFVEKNITEKVKVRESKYRDDKKESIIEKEG